MTHGLEVAKAIIGAKPASRIALPRARLHHGAEPSRSEGGAGRLGRHTGLLPSAALENGP